MTSRRCIYYMYSTVDHETFAWTVISSVTTIRNTDAIATKSYRNTARHQVLPGIARLQNIQNGGKVHLLWWRVAQSVAEWSKHVLRQLRSNYSILLPFVWFPLSGCLKMACDSNRATREPLFGGLTSLWNDTLPQRSPHTLHWNESHICVRRGHINFILWGCQPFLWDVGMDDLVLETHWYDAIHLPV